MSSCPCLTVQVQNVWRFPILCLLHLLSVLMGGEKKDQHLYFSLILRNPDCHHREVLKGYFLYSQFILYQFQKERWRFFPITHKCPISESLMLESCLWCFLTVNICCLQSGYLSPDADTHPKQLAQVSGAAVQRIRVGQHRGPGPAAGGTVHVLVLPGRNCLQPTFTTSTICLSFSSYTYTKSVTAAEWFRKWE